MRWISEVGRGGAVVQGQGQKQDPRPSLAFRSEKALLLDAEVTRSHMLTKAIMTTIKTGTSLLYCSHCDYRTIDDEERFCPEGHQLKSPVGMRPSSPSSYKAKCTGAYCATCGAAQRLHADQPRRHCHVCGDDSGRVLSVQPYFTQIAKIEQS